MYFAVDCFENQQADFWNPYKDGDVLTQVATMFVEADDDAEACEKVYYIGQKMGPDRYGNLWSAVKRSMSIGDVVAITHIDGQRLDTKRVYTVDSIGFKPATGIDVPSWRRGAF